MSDQAEATRFRPKTAREALLELRRMGSSVAGFNGNNHRRFCELVEDGLDCDGIENYELADQLADRLAEAHGILRGIRDAHDSARPERSMVSESLATKVGEALALPPDLEAMVDRRTRS